MPGFLLCYRHATYYMGNCGSCLMEAALKALRHA